jgi:hypothetical protein
LTLLEGLWKVTPELVRYSTDIPQAILVVSVACSGSVLRKEVASFMSSTHNLFVMLLYPLNPLQLRCLTSSRGTLVWFLVTAMCLLSTK